jgi:cysteine sulfinate desulfinase/cysteine desulfurase-like protein
LEAELANAQLAAAKDQVASQKTRLEAGEISKGDLEASAVSLAQAIAAAQTANANYQKAQLDAAALNLRRQKLLLALGSARKSDVARAEEKLAALRRGEQMP